MMDFGKYSFEILISYLGTFSLILILIITTYLDSKRVKKNLDKLTNDNLNDSKQSQSI